MRTCAHVLCCSRSCMCNCVKECVRMCARIKCTFTLSEYERAAACVRVSVCWIKCMRTHINTICLVRDQECVRVVRVFVCVPLFYLRVWPTWGPTRMRTSMTPLCLPASQCVPALIPSCAQAPSTVFENNQYSLRVISSNPPLSSSDCDKYHTAQGNNTKTATNTILVRHCHTLYVEQIHTNTKKNNTTSASSCYQQPPKTPPSLYFPTRHTDETL